MSPILLIMVFTEMSCRLWFVDLLAGAELLGRWCLALSYSPQLLRTFRTLSGPFRTMALTCGNVGWLCFIAAIVAAETVGSGNQDPVQFEFQLLVFASTGYSTKRPLGELYRNCPCSVAALKHSTYLHATA